MANLFIRKDRHVVPNFRRFSDTVALGELDAASTTSVEPPDVDFDSRIGDWRTDPSIGIAGDIVSAALVSGRENIPEVQEAAAFILEHHDTSSPALLSVANRLLSRDKQNPAMHSLPRLTTFVEENNRQKTF